MKIERNNNNKSALSVLEASRSFFLKDFSSLGQLLVVSFPLTSRPASNQNTSLHEVTTATVTATRTINSIKDKDTDFT